MSPTPAENGIHTPKELELMAKLKSQEEDRVKFVEIVRNKVKKLESELEVSMSFHDLYILSSPKFCVVFLLGQK